MGDEIYYRAAVLAELADLTGVGGGIYGSTMGLLWLYPGDAPGLLRKIPYFHKMLTLNFEPFPVLTTERLVLRKLRENDAEEVLYLRSHKDLMHFVPRPLLKDREDAKTFIHGNLGLVFRNEAINWGLTTKEEDKVIGILGLFNFNKENLRCEVGYILHDGWHGKGIMNEAVAAILHYGFSVLKLHSVEALIDPANFASAKVLEKNNFTKEAHFKENFFYNGQFMDTIIYSLLTPFR